MGMKRTNRLMTLGISLGLCAISGTALAHGGEQRRDDNIADKLHLSYYDTNGDRVVSLREMQERDIRDAWVEFVRNDLDRNGVLSQYEQAVARGEDCDPPLATYPTYHTNQRVERFPYQRVSSSPRIRVQLGRPYRIAIPEDVLTRDEMRRQAMQETWRIFAMGDYNNDGVLNVAELANLRKITRNS